MGRPASGGGGQRLEEAALPVMLDAMWAANVLDIESTVRSVCKKVGPLAGPCLQLWA